MSKKRVITWGELKTACKRRGVEVGYRGSEALLMMKLPDGRKVVHVLSHLCCKGKNSIVWQDHLAAIKRKFGFVDSDFER
jgi:hypothetical protein